MNLQKILAVDGGGQTLTVRRNKENHMTQNYGNAEMKAKKGIRTARRSTISAYRVRVARDSGRQITLSKAEALHLLALCSMSPLRLHDSEDALYAKLGTCARQR